MAGGDIEAELYPMKVSKLIWVLPLALSVGCVSHRPRTYTVVPAPASPVSSRETVRVYPSGSTVVTAPPGVVAATPPVVSAPVVTAPVVTTPGTVLRTPTVVTEVPPDLPPATVASSENLAVAENIRTMLSADPALNSAARDVRISVYNGRITMTGRTVTELERQRLHTALSRLPGISRVDDRIQVDLQR